MSYKRPSDSNLIDYAPLDIWHKAEMQAKRSNLYRFRTGAIIFNKKGKIIASGCSHISDDPTRSVHAEQHAMSKMWPAFDSLKCTCLIVTLTKGSNFAGSSRPCARCFNQLHQFNIQDVIWAERCNDDSWHIHKESVENMQNVIKSYDLTERFAKRLKVVI